MRAQYMVAVLCAMGLASCEKESTAPVPAPAAAPSGALVFFSYANVLLVRLSGNSTEMSFGEKPSALS